MATPRVQREMRAISILLVSADDSLIGRVTEAVGSDCSMAVLADPVAAVALISSRPLRGVIVDGSLRDRGASMLSRAFLLHQPVGRVAIVAALEDPSTLVGLAMRDPRVEVLFRPIDPSEIRAAMLGIPRIQCV